ncbi:hypothetical protein CC2G_009060 [Coprinopsis cinerea AmutBmut pab1-1]|nr:hypothetical protein CC2G_009060 [Coprinopsis cinerea AmutBmut pab1-1]
MNITGLVNPFLFCWLSIFFGTVLAYPKGGGGGGRGGGGRGKGGGKGKGQGRPKSKPVKIKVPKVKKRPPLVFSSTSGGKTTTICRDPVTNQQVPCPKNNQTGKIAGIVIGSLVGAVILGIGVFFAVRWWKKRKRTDDTNVNTRTIPDAGENSRGEYKRIEDPWNSTI